MFPKGTLIIFQPSSPLLQKSQQQYIWILSHIRGIDSHQIFTILDPGLGIRKTHHQKVMDKNMRAENPSSIEYICS